MEMSRILAGFSEGGYKAISSSDENNSSGDLTDSAATGGDNRISISNYIRFFNSRGRAAVAIAIAIIAVLSTTAYLMVSQYGGPSDMAPPIECIFNYGDDALIFTIWSIGGGATIYTNDVYVQVTNQLGNTNISRTDLLNASGTGGFYYVPGYGTNQKLLAPGDTFCLYRATSTSGYDSGSKIYLFTSSTGQYAYAILTVPELPKPNPQSEAILINGGMTYTNSTDVQLSFAARSDASQMRFSNDNVSWSSWEPFSTSKGWILTSGEGEKTVYVQFMDSASNLSIVYSDGIILDMDYYMA